MATTLNKEEQLKIEKDGLDVLADIHRYAKEGFDTIDPSDFIRFKWYGIYQQKPKTDPYFMMRVKIPGGMLTNEQAVTVAQLANDFGRGLADVTTRQAIQYHWLQIEHMPEIFDRLAAVGMSPIQACGDVVRNVISSPVAGLDAKELFDVRDLVFQVEKEFLSNKEFSNLPRKFKISIAADPRDLGHPEINDLALVPALLGDEAGYHILVGGGLSAKPYLAQNLGIFLRQDQALEVIKAVVSIFRDHGYREKRTHARVKFLMADWGPEKFLEHVEAVTGKTYTRGGVRQTEEWNGAYLYGVHPQKQAGLNFVGLSLPVGRISGDILLELARIAKKYGNGDLRTTNTQNIIIPNVADENVEALLAEPLLQTFSPQPSNFIGRAVACTGNEFCNLALVETKERMKSIATYLDETFPNFDTPIRLHVNGCPNSCGQQQIADIGLAGALVRIDGKMQDAYDISIGGGLGVDSKFNRKVVLKVPADDVKFAIEAIVSYYSENRTAGESFRSFANRVEDDAVKAAVEAAQQARA
ncbi:nitrite/sulfite reductase [Tumebacillus sp. ITR2]|uniref:Nitrite/sulfite reductase n=1 Tax=Tumebacillus amylolyticus TaxID=2801339 RepID=A0ABS1JAE3_9BACL|nr:nitrite/sulfite reductase [Tumebacillus amylolyticus]MBL0387241.1 nitrite/sulfite reductase [Tumebacillus amylolyticus]